jgi:hypothetical protein
MDIKSTFNKAPNGYWNNKDNQIEFMNELGIKLELKQLDDWYNISNMDIICYGGN